LAESTVSFGKRGAPVREVTIVVATRNRRADLARSLSQHTGPVILVDNGSTDGTGRFVRREFPFVEVIELPENRGAAARNIGVARAMTPYVAFADDDSWWADGALELAAKLFDEFPRLDVLASRTLVGSRQVLDPTCEAMSQAPLGQAADLPGPSVLGFIACGAVVRRSAYLAAGGFDDVVFFLGEEERLALDIAADGGGLAYVPSVISYHFPSASADRDGRRRLIIRNALLTALMRRPWSVVTRSCWVALTSGADSRAGLIAALVRSPRALRRRRPLPRKLEAARKALDQTPSC
jgi:GT2 family glycosyltransferase